jgi:valyl-tRNA synthetase
MSELPKAYDPKEAEERWYPLWEKHGLFHAKANPDKKPYAIVIPPPNITGILTMGHVLNNSIQDVFVRWKRMQGFETLWMPGTDHAGIATQNVVEKSLTKEGKTRHDLGRDEFIKLVWTWKEEYGGTIIKQLRKLGTSCDWERERFTMDEGLSNAVREIFVRLYERGLIYRGKYIVNWCPKDHTAISDDEVEYNEQQSHLWYIKYPIKDLKDYAIVATTRPETMLGDTAIAVNPKDERYKHLVGRMAILPLANRDIPVITDDFVDPQFGTGMVKVTPAHDPNDYWIGERHNANLGQRHVMAPINIYDISARMNDNVPEKYRGMDRFDARKAVLRDLEALGLVLKTEPYVHNVGHCYRCHTIIEPYLSDQWFVKMKPLAEQALSVVLDGKIKFHPDRWTKVYEHWMTNIRDWCISRQLWWGHRIPVWYCVGEGRRKLECNQPIVSRTPPEKCPHCGTKNLRQDEDVLDTWFSSWLWPFSTLGWPGDNPDLRYFYPTDVLVTAPDIIFFWVARMIMAGLEVMGDIPLHDGSPRKRSEDLIPFRDVYFTSIIRDVQGRKMSKSLGNSPDPLDVIAEYGADALRFTILYLAPLGQDVLYSNDKCELGRNFANKVWNAGRFLLMNKQGLEVTGSGNEKKEAKPQTSNLKPQTTGLHLDLADRWILSRLHSTIGDLTTALEQFELNQATKILYDFVWHDYCDWYVEWIKKRMSSESSTGVKTIVLERAIHVFDNALRLLHPFMPFVTEELWQNIRRRQPTESIMIAEFPKQDSGFIDKQAERDFEQPSIEAVSHFRFLKAEQKLSPSQKPLSGAVTHSEEYRRKIEEAQPFIVSASGIWNQLEFPDAPPAGSGSVVAPSGTTYYVLSVDPDHAAKEKERIRKEIIRLEGMLESVKKRLADDAFLNKAPKDIIDKERAKLQDFRATLEKLQKKMETLNGT